jgi:hypothetical protein
MHTSLVRKAHLRSLHRVSGIHAPSAIAGLHLRSLSTTSRLRQPSPASSLSDPALSGVPPVVAEPLPANPAASRASAPSISAFDGYPSYAPEYAGPMAPTLRRLKMFSLGSCVLTAAFTPFLFVLEAPLPLMARASLAGTALAASGASTALVAWTAGAYVVALRRRGAGTSDRTLEMETRTLFLRPRTTAVFDTAFLGPAGRPFATWGLKRDVQLPRGAAHPPAGAEETVAETADERGNVVGRWIVRWGEGGAGTCRESGKVVRCVFSLPLRVAGRRLIPCGAGTSTCTRRCSTRRCASAARRPPHLRPERPRRHRTDLATLSLRLYIPRCPGRTVCLPYRVMSTLYCLRAVPDGRHV